MDEYPEELRIPPLALVALVGVSELHPLISSHLHQEQPPINTLAVPDFAKAGAVVMGGTSRPPDARLPPPLGILKSHWLSKHRTRVPAALVILLHRQEVCGDPSQWLQICTHLDNIKNLIRGRNTKLVVIVVQPTISSGDINEDRMVTLRKRAEVESKCFFTFISQDAFERNRSLARLGNLLGELSIAFYKDEGKRVKQRLEKRAFNSTELAVRYNFKIAVYAEFRRDWVEALKFYEATYSLLQEMAAIPLELQLVQRLVEVKAVAEQLNFKISTLLLYTRKEIEAVKFFRQHLAFFKRFLGPPESRFLHYAWVSKQILAFADMLPNIPISQSSTPSSLPELSVTEWEFQPAYHYQMAATYIVERRRAFESSSAVFEALDMAEMEDVLDGPPEIVGPPLYVGQAARLLNHGSSLDLQRPTDKEFVLHAYKAEKSFGHSSVAINLFTKAYESYKLLQAHRVTYQLASEIGREYFIAKDYTNAREWLSKAVGVYRKEAWVVLLWTTLGYLRVCAKELELFKEYAEYTLEMASLPANENKEDFFEPHENPAGSLSVIRREKLFHDVMLLLMGKLERYPEPMIVLDIDAVSPLQAVLSVCAAFHENSLKPGRPALLTLALMTHLPLTLVFEQVEVCFNQNSCNFSLKSTSAGEEEALETSKIRSGFNLELEPNKWKRFETHVTPGQSGRLECLSIIAHIGKHSVLSCQVESPASREDTSFWKFEPQIGGLPMEDSGLSYFGQKAIQVDEPDVLVDLTLEVSGMALVGELFTVRIRVKPRGHAMHKGSMKISMVESSKLPMMSPRDAVIDSPLTLRIFTADSTSPPVGKSCQLNPFSGTIVVPPFVEANQEWSTQLYLMWQKPQSVNLFVSLSYHPKPTDEMSSPLSVHKGMQLLCEEAFVVSHRYLSSFRNSALLLGVLDGIKQSKVEIIPANETSTLMVTAKNSCSVNLKLMSVTVEEKDASFCSVRPTNALYSKFHGSFAEEEGVFGDAMTTLKPGETFSQLFSVKPAGLPSAAVDIGIVRLKWVREGKKIEAEEGEVVVEEEVLIVTDIPLALVRIEKPPLVLALDCPPPHVFLGKPFTVSYKVENQTAFLQEIKFSVADSPGFLFSGSHTDTIHVLPHATDLLSYRLVPLLSGIQQLPQISLTATRYNAGFLHSPSVAQIYVLPSERVADSIFNKA